jgi:hypothetical protein
MRRPFASATHDLIEQLERAPLLTRHRLGITDDVDEEHIGNLQLDLFLNFGGHAIKRRT